jgi:hypothetical protein
MCISWESGSAIDTENQSTRILSKSRLRRGVST